MKIIKNRISRIIILLIGLIFLGNNIQYAQAPQSNLPTGLEIVQNINKRDDGKFVSRTIIMELIHRSGKKRVRKVKSFRKYFDKDKRTIIYYLSPKNIEGTSFMTYDYRDPKVDDDQWLYLPAARKVRRISASDRGNYFLGTDLTYNEIKNESKVNIDDYTWKTLGEEVVDGHPTYIIEAIPVNEEVMYELGYNKVHMWIDKEIWIARKSEFWDINGNHLKVIKTKDIKKVLGIWTLHIIEAENFKTGHKTIFRFSDIDYKTKFSDDLFTKRSLKRGL